MAKWVKFSEHAKDCEQCEVARLAQAKLSSAPPNISREPRAWTIEQCCEEGQALFLGWHEAVKVANALYQERMKAAGTSPAVVVDPD